MVFISSRKSGEEGLKILNEYLQNKIENLKNTKAYQQSNLQNNSNELETFYGLSRNVVFKKMSRQ